MAKKNKKTVNGEGVPGVVFGEARRMIVTYVDGSWTDNLAIERYGLHPGPDGLSLTIDVAPRERVGKVRVARQALRDFVSRLRKVHTIQIGKPKFSTHLRVRVKELESSVIGVKLSANGRAVTYPAGVVFGPDATTLNLG